ncbi:DUF2972 domain-containing protein, partial [Campylobacter jejuni]|nr:DUF2972 domain-containing protein [Campylobacter jejuni]MHH37738.1 DUF2972 domain-containing protein [Campylobacter jejuni]
MQFNIKNIDLILEKDIIKKYRRQIIKWIQTKEFEENYSHFLYPPLLNPNNVDYCQISPEVSWELNLPLPPFYRFVYWGSHGCGNTAFGVFLAKYGGYNFYSTNENDGRKAYISLFKDMISKRHLLKKDKFGYLAIRNYVDGNEHEKFHFLIHSSSAINLVRDPISCLKHYIGMKRYYNKSIRRFNLTFNPKDIFKELVGYSCGNEIKKTPSLEAIESWIDFRYKCFHDGQLIQEMKNIKETIVIDMREIVGKNSFNTMQNIARYYKLKTKFYDDGTMQEKVAEYEGILPLTLYVHPSDIKDFYYDNNLKSIDGIDIFITTHYWLPFNGFVPYETQSRFEGVVFPEKVEDITKYILNYQHDKIIICVRKGDFKKIKKSNKLYKAIQQYIIKLIPYIEKQKDIEEKKKIHERDILEFFNKNKTLCAKFKNILDIHL